MNIYILASGVYKVMESAQQAIALFVVDIPSGVKSWWSTGGHADKAWIPDDPDCIPAHVREYIEEKVGPCTYEE